LFIGVKKLGFTEKEVGHMTYSKWHRLYQAYQNNFDVELAMKLAGKGYKDLKEIENRKEHIISF